MRFRAMKTADVPQVARLERVCFRSPWSERALRGELKNKLAHYQVLEINGEVIAYAGMWVLFEEAHITNVAVEPRFRGRGFGKKLMLHMMKTAVLNGASRMTLEVRESNASAQKLYFSLGFEKAGVRKRYYSDTGEDGWILWHMRIQSALEEAGQSTPAGEADENEKGGTSQQAQRIK